MLKYALPWVLLVSIAGAQNPAPTATPDVLVAKAKQTYAQQGPAAALPEFERAFELYRAAEDRRGEAVALGYIANCQRRLGNLTKALDLAQQALRMKEALGDRVEIGKTYNQLGLIHWELADYPAATKEFQEAIAIGRAAANPELEGSALNNLGLVFDEVGEYHRSLTNISVRSSCIGPRTSSVVRATRSAILVASISCLANSKRPCPTIGRRW